MQRHSTYLQPAMVNRRETIDKIVKRLQYFRRKKGLKFDAIAFTGLSGALIGPSVADRLGVGIVAVRKNVKNIVILILWLSQLKKLKNT